MSPPLLVLSLVQDHLYDLSLGVRSPIRMLSVITSESQMSRRRLVNAIYAVDSMCMRYLLTSRATVTVESLPNTFELKTRVEHVAGMVCA